MSDTTTPALGDDEDHPLTHDTGDQAWKFCRCARCGHVSRCTPDFDYWACSAMPVGKALLYCEPCFDGTQLPTDIPILDQRNRSPAGDT